MIPALSLSQNSEPPAAADSQQLQQAAQAFEAIFLRDMIGAMRKAGLGDDVMGNSGSTQFRDMMDDRLADEMVRNNGLGIADLLVAQWKGKL